MPAVLVHGVPDTAVLWDPVREHLTRDDVVALSLPGFATPVPDGFGATKEEYVDWLAAELAAIGEPVDLVGHDWGAMLVQRVASLHPDRIRTVACGSGPVDRTYTWHPMAQAWQTPETGEQIMEGMLALSTADLAAGFEAGGAPAALSHATGRAGRRDDDPLHPRSLPVRAHAGRGLGGRDRGDAAPPGARALGCGRPLLQHRDRRPHRRTARRRAARLRRLQPLVAVERAEATAAALEELWARAD